MYYLNIVKEGLDSFDSQVFSMTLLVNAKLPTQTFSNLGISLINNIVNKNRTYEESINMDKERMVKLYTNLCDTEQADEVLVHFSGSV